MNETRSKELIHGLRILIFSSSSSFVTLLIFVILKHPFHFMVYYYLFGVFFFI